MPPGLEAASEEEERPRRGIQRREGVASVKRSAAYAIAMQRWSEGGGNPARRRTRTPDPTDSSISNRKWELGMQAWRKELSTVREGETATVPSPR